MMMRTGRPMASWHMLRVVGWCAVVCLVLAACSAPWRASAPTTTPTATAVVAATAPSDPHDYTCPGIPDEALEAMFGQKTTISTPRTGAFFKGSECWVKVPEQKSLIFYSTIGYIYRDRDPWDDPWISLGNTHSTFSFPDVDGFGEARIDTGPNAHYGTTVFTCEDHYLVLTVGEFSLTRGDVRTNLINLTQSALPWLCQDQPIPGLDQTMEQARPPWATTAPTEQATP